MTDYEYSGPEYKVLSRRFGVRARIDHVCDTHNHAIKAGELYDRQSILDPDEGKVFTYKTCRQVPREDWYG